MKYIFLLYMPRSGSTLLAQRLANISDKLLVLPETKFVESLMVHANRSNSAETRGQLREIIVQDPRWENLGISAEQLEEVLLEKPTVNVTYIVRRVCELYAKSRDRNEVIYCVIKNSNSIWSFEKLIKIFGKETTFLHIVRDPRGVASSILKGNRAFNRQFTLGVESLGVAKRWRRYIQTVERIKRRKMNVIEIKYEQFLENPERHLTEISTALNLSLIHI